VPILKTILDFPIEVNTNLMPANCERYQYIGSLVDTGCDWFSESYNSLNEPAFTQVCLKLSDGTTISRYVEAIKKRWKQRDCKGQLYYCWTVERSPEKQLHYHLSLMCEASEIEQIAIDKVLLTKNSKLLRAVGGNAQFVGGACPLTGQHINNRVLSDSDREGDLAFNWFIYSLKAITKPSTKRIKRLIGTNQSANKKGAIAA
jgi:hypothetical protein